MPESTSTARFDCAKFTRRLRLVLGNRCDPRSLAPWCTSHGINPTTVRNLLRGGYAPNSTTLFKLCSALDVSADYLLGLEDR